eukprot:GHVN01099333.1.p1 GENE.GHVN01099333.1~~GHVN01099333.1.p1  ORF type:complete len:161 (-),score=11.94 GHVN01099333.1:282-764(-)
MGAVAMVNCPTAIPPCSRGTASINVAIATSIVLQRFAEWAASRGDWVPNTVIPNRLVCGLGKFSVQEVPSVDYEEQRALGERVCQERWEIMVSDVEKEFIHPGWRRGRQETRPKRRRKFHNFSSHPLIMMEPLLTMLLEVWQLHSTLIGNQSAMLSESFL